MKAFMKPIRSLPLFAIALVFSTTGATLYSQEPSDTWPQFRGPNRDSRYHGPAWPESISADHLRPTWRVELGPSYGGAIVSRDRVFVNETADEKYEVVTALERKTGEVIWRTQWEGATKVDPMGDRTGSWIKSTLTYDGERLYIAGMRDVLVCLDAETGRELWRADFMERFGGPIPELGFISSPLVVGDTVVSMAADSVVSVDKYTGAPRWRNVIRDALGHGSYSSAEFGVLHGRPQILASTIPAMNGLDPETGEVLWRIVIDGQANGLVLPPFVYGDGVFTSSRHSQTGYYPITLKDGVFSIERAWRNKVVDYLSYPILFEDHAYMHLGNQRMACVDLKTGKEKWISSERFGMYISQIVQGDRILALSNEGELMLMRMNPEGLDILERRTIAEAETWAHLALAGSDMHVREQNAIQAYEWN